MTRLTHGRRHPPATRRRRRALPLALCLGAASLTGCLHTPKDAEDPAREGADPPIAHDPAAHDPTAPDLPEPPRYDIAEAPDDTTPRLGCSTPWTIRRVPGDHTREAARAAIETATALWSDATGLDFTWVDDPAAAALHIDEVHIDGPGGLLGQLRVTPSAIVLEVDNAEFWSVDGDPGDFELEQVTAHLIGHLLGLDHTDDPDDLMHPTYSTPLPRGTHPPRAATPVPDPCTLDTE